MTGPVTTGLALALPRAGALTDAVMAPPTDVVPAEALADLRAQVAGDLAAVVEAMAEGERLRFDAFRFVLARRHPELAGGDGGPFVPSPARCRRAVGLSAVARCLRGRSPTPASAVAEVLAAGVEDAADVGDPAGRPPWWAAWYGGLPAGGRAMVEAEAVTWATQLWTALEWERLAQATVGGDDWWDCPRTRRLTLRGQADVRVRPGGRPVLLVVGGGVPPPDWRGSLGFPALVAALAGRERSVPARVVGLWPASGQVRILPVDSGVLTDTAAAVVDAVAVWVRRRGRPSR
ncbi:MAG TPA: hypothetical protein VN816_00910 [Acidimicrobiales bacterium]|nr:hypothetical protein [Acidimicrobiales bacterium]